MYEVAGASSTLGEASSGMNSRQRILSVYPVPPRRTSLPFASPFPFASSCSPFSSQPSRKGIAWRHKSGGVDFCFPFLTVLQNLKTVKEYQPPPTHKPRSALANRKSSQGCGLLSQEMGLCCPGYLPPPFFLAIQYS